MVPHAQIIPHIDLVLLISLQQSDLLFGDKAGSYLTGGGDIGDGYLAMHTPIK